MAIVNRVGELLPQCASHLFPEVLVCWTESALPSIKSHIPCSRRSPKQWCQVTTFRKKRIRNHLDTFTMWPTCDPIETVIVIVFETSHVGLCGLTERDCTLCRWMATIFSIPKPKSATVSSGALQSPMCYLRNKRGRKTVPLLTAQRGRSGSAPLKPAWHLCWSLRPTLTGCMNLHMILIKK